MATRCSSGSVFDESGVCGCGAGHEDPSALRDHASRLAGEDSCADPICKRCGRPLEAHSDRELAACHPALSDPEILAPN